MQDTQTPSRPGPSIARKDPTVQVVDSAYQIITMIGANPRAIRPILAQRRLTKEQVLDAADSLTERVGAMLVDLDRVDAERRALHDSSQLELKDRIEAWQAEREVGAAQHEEAPAEIARLQAELDAASAAFARFDAEQQRVRGYLTNLSDRAARVREVYQGL